MLKIGFDPPAISFSDNRAPITFSAASARLKPGLLRILNLVLAYQVTFGTGMSPDQMYAALVELEDNEFLDFMGTAKEATPDRSPRQYAIQRFTKLWNDRCAPRGLLAGVLEPMRGEKAFRLALSGAWDTDALGCFEQFQILAGELPPPGTRYVRLNKLLFLASPREVFPGVFLEPIQEGEPLTTHNRTSTVVATDDELDVSLPVATLAIRNESEFWVSVVGEVTHADGWHSEAAIPGCVGTLMSPAVASLRPGQVKPMTFALGAVIIHEEDPGIGLYGPGQFVSRAAAVHEAWERAHLCKPGGPLEGLCYDLHLRADFYFNGSYPLPRGTVIPEGLPKRERRGVSFAVSDGRVWIGGNRSDDDYRFSRATDEERSIEPESPPKKGKGKGRRSKRG